MHACSQSPLFARSRVKRGAGLRFPTRSRVKREVGLRLPTRSRAGTGGSVGN